MSINRKLGDLANVLDDGTEGQVLSFNASGAIAAADIAAGASVYDSAELLPLTGLSAGDMAYVTGTNRFYISNGTGWYSVSLVNTNPSITSVQDSDGLTTPFTLTTDGTATVITVTASDPEDIPLTYNYSVTAGSLTNGGGTTATVSQADNVFTVTPSTTEAYAGTFSLTFTASDGINTDTSVNSFTLEFITIIANSKYTTLLATATDTSDNNNITDASTNNYSITVNGDAHAGTFSPYRSGGYSTYFDGTGDYLSISSNASLNFDYDAFTIEFWVQSSVKTNFQTVAAKYNSSDTTGFFILLNSSGNLLFGANPSSYITSSGTDICDGAWHHISCTRSVSSGVGTMTIYIDGSSAGTLNRLDNVYNTVDFEIGRQNAVNRPLTGYVSDLRVVKGTAITPPSGGPTERLEAVTNTSLLTCHLPYISDGSSNDHSITVNGDPEIKPFSPYDYNEYSATDHGGSVYFDGSGDYLDTNSAINFSSSGGCIEGWVYITSATNYAFFIASTQGAGSFEPRWYVGHTNAGDWRVAAGDAISNNLTSSDLIKNQWHHFVLSNDGSRSRLFANGVLIFTKSVTPLNENLTFTLSKYGPYAQYLMTGNLSDVRVTTSIPTEYQTSSTTVGSSIFTPPTAPLSSSGAELHIKGTDASIIDKSQSGNLKLVGNTTGSTTQAKFANTKSMYFDGTGDYITNLPDDLFAFGYDPYTIEFWIYTASYPSYSGSYHIMGSSTSAGDKLVVKLNSQIALGDCNGDINTYGTSVYANMPTAGNWVHVAFVRTGILTNQCKCYINGTVGGSDIDNKNWGTATDNNIGATASGNYAFNGYIQDLRVTKGLARYTSNFTPPTASLKG